MSRGSKGSEIKRCGTKRGQGEKEKNEGRERFINEEEESGVERGVIFNTE